MKNEKTEVSRTLEVPGQQNVKRSTTVSRQLAEQPVEMLALCGGDLSKAMKYFNEGRWASLRTKVSNSLANKTPQQKAIDKIVAGYKAIMKCSDAEARSLVVGMPQFASLDLSSNDTIPAEIDENWIESNLSSDESETEENVENVDAAPVSA